MSDRRLRQRKLPSNKPDNLDITDPNTPSTTRTSPRLQKARSSSTTPPVHASSRTTVTTAMEDSTDDPRQPLLAKAITPSVEPAAALFERHVSSDDGEPEEPENTSTETQEESMDNLSKKSQWIVLALASGGCAAFNGVFAKLTTTELTTRFATWIANLIGLGTVEGGVEVVVRAIFFSLNLIFNGIMWALFTKALARGTSTTQVSILNTSANFMITAVLGFIIFNESLPPLWFLGAGMLVAGNVIIGRREEGEGKNDGEEHVRAENGLGAYEDEGEGFLEGEELELDESLNGKSNKDEDILDLDIDDDDDGGAVKTKSGGELES